MLRALFLVTAIASPVVVPGDSLRTYRFRDSTVKTNIAPREAKAVGKRIDSYCALLEDFFAPFGLKKKQDGKVVARVFRSREEFEEFRDKDVGAKRWIAYHSRRLNSIVCYHDAEAISVRQTLFHEVSHQFFARYFTSSPKWINEGLAECFEGWVGEGEKVEQRPNLYDLIVVQEAIRQDNHLSLEQLINFNALEFVDFAEHHPDKHSTLHYATSWALVYWLLEEEPERLAQYLRDLGDRPDRARYDCDDWGELESRWKKAMLAMEPVRQDASDHFSIAAGYRQNGEYDRAITEYRSGLEKNPSHTWALYWLGYSLKRTGNYKAARKILSQAIELRPEDPRAPYLLARIEGGIDRKNSPADPPLALELAHQASTAAGGRDPFYLEFVADCQVRAGDPKKAVKTLRKVLSLVEEDDDKDRLRKKMAEI